MIYKCPVCGDKREYRLPRSECVGRLRCVNCGFEALVENDEEWTEERLVEWEEVKCRNE